MYFPQDMNFQYFFFSTYPGYFLQALPFALAAGIIYIVYQKKGKRQSSIGKMILPSLFVCYMTGLLCLTLFQSIVSDIYYYLVLSFWNSLSNLSQKQYRETNHRCRNSCFDFD